MNRIWTALGAAIIGLALMVIGLATTSIALGQDAPAEVTEEAAVPVPTLTPTVVMETGAANRQSRSVAHQERDQAGNREERPSRERNDGQGNGAPGRRQEQPGQGLDSATPLPASQGPPDASAISPDDSDHAGHGRGRENAPGQNQPEPGKGNAAGAGQSQRGGAGEVVLPDPAAPEAADAVLGAEPPAGEAPVDTTVKPEPAAPVEAESVPSLVFGRVDSQARVSVTLTLPTGQSITQAADAQGAFLFEVTEPGEYRLVAAAPGALSRQMIFNLEVGQQVELPPTRLSPGDVNQDSRIDMSDIVLVAANYDGPALVAQADVNGDAWIDISDLALVGAKFGLAGPLPWDSP